MKFGKIYGNYTNFIPGMPLQKCLAPLELDGTEKTI